MSYSRVFLYADDDVDLCFSIYFLGLGVGDVRGRRRLDRGVC